MLPLSLFLANMIYIFLKAFQQKNVMHSNKVLMMPTSYGMACCEYFIMGSIALAAVSGGGLLNTIINISAIGIGGGIGSVLACEYHDKYISKKKGAN